MTTNNTDGSQIQNVGNIDQNSQGLIVEQPRSHNLDDENIRQGSNDEFVNRQGHTEISKDVNLSDNDVMNVTQNCSTPETILQQAVNEHIAAVTDLSHHPPGKRFDVIGRLLDRRVSEKLKKEIWENKYIDLNSLLPQEDKEDLTPILAPGKPGEPAKWQEPKIS